MTFLYIDDCLTDHRPQNLTLYYYNVFLWTVDYCTVDSCDLSQLRLFIQDILKTSQTSKHHLAHLAINTCPDLANSYPNYYADEYVCYRAVVH